MQKGFPGQMFSRVLSVLLPVLLTGMLIVFTGCQMDDDLFEGIWLDKSWLDGSRLEGTWESPQGGDSFIINMGTLQLEYDDGGWGMDYSGNIQGIMLFNASGTAGVIFIEYSETGKPTDWDWSDSDNPVPIPVEGDFVGIFFRNLTSTSGQFAAPADKNFRTPAQTTLEQAKSAFTEDTAGNYVSVWVTYEKK